MQTESKREDIFDRMMGLPGLRIFKPLYQNTKKWFCIFSLEGWQSF